MRPGAALDGLVIRVEQVALVDRETAAADARGQPFAQRLQGRDPRVEVRSPAVREALPVAAAGGTLRRETIERRADLAQRDPGRTACLDEGDPAQDGPVVAALVAVRAL